jgi:LuxR family quorum sensing-dependent transcriptional regulator
LIFDEAREFGFTNGFATPSFHLDGSISTILLMGRNIDDRDPDVRAAAHLMSIYYASISRRLSNRWVSGAVKPILSPRQLECLKWVRQGKSATDIGDILGLSAHTVNEHVAAACSRLGVRTRTQAVAEAALHGILEL